MSFLNKKVLAAAIVGSLFAGSAFAAPLDVTRQYYAQEIVFPAGGLVPTAAPSLVWESGYNYSINEVKYVRVELTGATFSAATPVVPTVVGGNVGAINGLGTNVITFSVTSVAPIVAANNFTMPLAGSITIPAKSDVSVKVSLYDQASQAQAGGTTGLLSIGSYDNTVFLSFVRSYAFTNDANSLVADVATTPVRYGNFLPDGSTTPPTTTVAGTLNDNLAIDLVDPDGATGGQGATFAADGSEITLAELFGAGSRIDVTGNFAAASTVTLATLAPTQAPAGTPPTYPGTLSWTGVPTGATAPLVYTVPGDRAIAAGNFQATFIPIAASADYTVAPLTANSVGTIRRNGLELQAPLAQVPPAWLSRLVLTNTGATSPAYSITVLGEDGQTITTANTSGTVKPGTNVVDLKTVMTGFSDGTRQRGTLVVNVEAPDAPGASDIQGLYQIVNPESGSISNHVMVRPGTN